MVGIHQFHGDFVINLAGRLFCVYIWNQIGAGLFVDKGLYY